MKNRVLVILTLIVVIASTLTIIITRKVDNRKIEKEDDRILQESEGIYVVPTMSDVIKEDSSYCGTFSLVWNDMKNEVVKKDVVFTPQEVMAENLNKEEFNEDLLSDEYYYKIYGLKSLELKNTIEKGIKEKFNEKSDILDDFDWSDDALNDPNNVDTSRYFFYTMLYRKFDFIKEFDKLENGNFGDKYSDIKYFGINEKTNNGVGNQIEVLYYNSQDDFAILINTKTNDEVIFVKNPKGSTFNEIYSNMRNEQTSYTGKKSFQEIDEFKAPNLMLNVKREYTEFENKPFYAQDGDLCVIAKAIQTIKLKLGEKGGEIKSEAAIDMVKSAAFIPQEQITQRYFYVDNTFVLFLREKGKELPYFAARVDDITKYQ